MHISYENFIVRIELVATDGSPQYIEHVNGKYGSFHSQYSVVRIQEHCFNAIDELISSIDQRFVHYVDLAITEFSHNFLCERSNFQPASSTAENDSCVRRIHCNRVWYEIRNKIDFLPRLFP